VWNVEIMTTGQRMFDNAGGWNKTGECLRKIVQTEADPVFWNGSSPVYPMSHYW